MTPGSPDRTDSAADRRQSHEVPPTEPSMDIRDVERESAMVRLFDGHHTQLLRLAVLLGAEQDAEDIVAEAFCQLHRGWYRLRDPEAGPRYLRSVVVNLVRMRIRHLKVLRKHIDVQEPSIESAEATALLHEDQRRVVDALNSLPARQREALVLRYWLDLKESEIAEAMGISKGAVKSHTSRGMQALSRAMGAHS
ncbi:SigE family RNA polymerase sigma factor [Saccharopolyspora sp. WRP15-2]|uniref:SigE family RNA polymerase sigma factor n=1 Tax=Saccharopolyspora oryzae TaxID=2997343 RepID=A0ABT4UV54_9PSEU|nr:SigE family RNA polymerase sigma factor [Saccharopolyspora oryzae]MDA3625590.1 SigE family RNA polymerase sigma factor [Saccharopolyspora oryzae]